MKTMKLHQKFRQIKRTLLKRRMQRDFDRYIESYILKKMKEHHSSQVAHSNRIASIRKHLEESKIKPPNLNSFDQPLNDKYQEFYDYLNKSPINRHDVSTFNKLIYENDFNPKISEKEMYRFSMDIYMIDLNPKLKKNK